MEEAIAGAGPRKLRAPRYIRPPFTLFSHHYHHHGDLRQNHDFDYVDDYILQRLSK